MNFQIVSDIHIEYKFTDDSIPINPLSLITPSAENLIFAGDIGSFYKPKILKNFLMGICKYYKKVFYVPGNHEYYTTSNHEVKPMKYLLSNFKKLVSDITNLTILSASSVCIDDVCIVGCTLWTKPLISVPKFIVRIPSMNTKYYSSLYESELDYLKRMINFSKENCKKLLVITHHCPSFSLITKKKGDKYISMYASNLDYLLNKNDVHTWVAGHIHKNFDLITENGTRLVSNQLGKPKDHIKDFVKNKVINL
jgi:predicted phosphodiesterase